MRAFHCPALISTLLAKGSGNHIPSLPAPPTLEEIVNGTRSEKTHMYLFLEIAGNSLPENEELNKNNHEILKT